MATGLDEEFEKKKQIKEREITLVSGDGKKFQLSSTFACISPVLEAALLDEECKEIEQKDIKGNILEEIVNYMNLRKGIDMEELKWPIQHKTMKEICGRGNEESAEFIDRVAKHRRNFQDLLLATVRLQIKGLQSLGVAKIACLLKWCKSEDLDRVLDPNITDGKLLPLRPEIIEERKKEEEERKKAREERKKAREAKEAKEAKEKEMEKEKDKEKEPK
mmetsp:Transcript_27740/g.38587  ORF Transcript_27740/g.38587 Transcript_27740/m.38587 type:complete len:219 (+) Transcript_27740:214-870(+)|eukprot:CAMPEP_0184478556 /NCGR_PEP_ID=MMETSP0113_2-20130426/555_1 /TAXON_ID=91329 /ORGANISM="Norrisiella sphaerica, Strain BC52" /LENGTH=218 /DNA_ID=CAMNT_0026856397 /DNA_START=214 /DNA_END=870 /DNA_ORIENTATION=+